MTTILTAALFHFLWRGAVIALFLAVALCFTRSPRARYAIACIALLAMPIAFVCTAIAAIPSSAPVPPIQAVTLTAGENSIQLSGTNSTATSTAAPPIAEPINVVTLWLTGIAILYAYRLTAWLAAQRLRHRGVCAAPIEWQRRLAALSTRSVKLFESALIQVPMTIGVFRPVILMPLGILTNLPANQIEAILLHELAHIRRKDYLINLAQSAIEGLLFYHPAVWWVSHVIRQERELCCDDEVIAATADATTYVRALAALEQHRVPNLTLAATGGPLGTRIRHLLGETRPRYSFTPAFAFLLLSAAATAGMAYRPQSTPLPQPMPAIVFVPQSAPQVQPTVARQRATQILAQVAPPPTPPPNNELETPYTKWLNEEVVWIITDNERAAFNRLQTDDERQQFIEQFWLRRDPTPDTIANEFREEHYRRIAFANDQFASDNVPGWKSARGKIYIKYGPPDTVDFSLGGIAWTYRFIEGTGANVTIRFIDLGNGDFSTVWTLTEPAAGVVPIPEWNPFNRPQPFANVRPKPAQ